MGDLDAAGICSGSLQGAVAALIVIPLVGLPRATARAGSETITSYVGTKAALFPRPAALEPNVDFWIKAFTYWGERDFVVHDREHIAQVYQTFHMPGDGAPTREE